MMPRSSQYSSRLPSGRSLANRERRSRGREARLCRNQAGTGLNERTGKLGAMPGDDMRGVRFMVCCQPSANARHRRMGRQLA